MHNVEYEKGYLIWATGDYKYHAINCAKSIRAVSDLPIVLFTDSSMAGIAKFFKDVRYFSTPIKSNPFSFDYQCWYNSPFRETIKVEADMMFPRSIDHWFNMFRHRDVVLTSNVRNYKNEIVTDRSYRKIIDENDLPDVYNGLAYWRVSKIAAEFKRVLKHLFHHWDEAQEMLKLGKHDSGTTDVVYALAAKIVGVEKVTLPNTSYPSFIHMKQAFNHTIGKDWTKEMLYEFEDGFRINTIEQEYPFHYHIKEFLDIYNGY